VRDLGCGIFALDCDWRLIWFVVVVGSYVAFLLETRLLVCVFQFGGVLSSLACCLLLERLD
jgi:hypothetical protein